MSHLYEEKSWLSRTNDKGFLSCMYISTKVPNFPFNYSKSHVVLLSHVSWKVFQATTSITEGLENKMTWYGFLDLRINFSHSQIMQTVGKYLRNQSNILPSNSIHLIFLNGWNVYSKFYITKKFLLRYLESALLKIVNAEPNVDQIFSHRKNFSESVKVSYWSKFILSIIHIWSNMLKPRETALHIWRQLKCTLKKSVF